MKELYQRLKTLAFAIAKKEGETIPEKEFDEITLLEDGAMVEFTFDIGCGDRGYYSYHFTDEDLQKEDSVIIETKSRL